MVECVCINDKNKPAEVPANKWIKKGNKYNVIFTLTVMPQKVLAFHLDSPQLDDSCKPFEYFLASRFAFTEEGIRQLMQLIADCEDTEFSLEELMEQTQLVDL